MNDGAYALGLSCIGSAVSPRHMHNSRKPPFIAGAFFASMRNFVPVPDWLLGANRRGVVI